MGKSTRRTAEKAAKPRKKWDAYLSGGRIRGFMVAFSFSSDAEAECSRIYKKDGVVIKLLTVQEILDESFVQKM